MTCQQAQTRLSLYLYGELDFAQEEEIEQHLAECALCERALLREKSWHTALNAGNTDVSLDLLAECRQTLKKAVSRSNFKPMPHAFRLRRWAELFGFSGTRWSLGIAAASFLVFAGFAAARWIDRNGLSAGMPGSNLIESSLISPSNVRIRDIQPGGGDRVHIVIDRVREQAIDGRLGDQDVRQLLLSATRDSDPGIRVDSVEMLKDQNGDDVRDALIASVEHDPNAAVRLKAMEALRRYTDDPGTRTALKFALENDDNPGVRSEAIDILAPANRSPVLSPDLAGTLQQIMRSERDEYVRLRCLSVLREMNASLDVY
ncbi:MAG: HEAT repeat domain-containing protein [Acidobacteriaceae bacterium]|nr:HEAT repeat domain-containing protein [Acidobacteriaceae bacterium]